MIQLLKIHWKTDNEAVYKAMKKYLTEGICSDYLARRLLKLAYFDIEISWIKGTDTPVDVLSRFPVSKAMGDLVLIGHVGHFGVHRTSEIEGISITEAQTIFMPVTVYALMETVVYNAIAHVITSFKLPQSGKYT